MNAKKNGDGTYNYKGYELQNCGYHSPDKCTWWQAIDLKTGCADFHETTKKHLMKAIDNAEREDSEKEMNEMAID